MIKLTHEAKGTFAIRPSSWNGVGAIAKVPLASWVSFIIICLYRFTRRSGTVRRTGPGTSRFRARDFVAPRNDDINTSSPPRRFLDLLLREENLTRMGHDILRPPPRERRLPAIHLHHPHFAHPARAGNT